MASGAILYFLANAGYAKAEDLVLYCGVNEPWCRAVSAAFEKETGIKVQMTRKSAGETYAQVKAEADNPKGDIWFGGTGDPHLQAADEGLTLEYKSEKLSELYPWAQEQAKRANYKSVGIYTGVLGFSYNTDLLAKKKLSAPKCWADLLKPEYKDEVQVADPNSSGTAYTLLATILQLMGEDKGFDYLKNLHKNVNQYTKSGAAPAKAVGQGETLIGITFEHDAITPKVAGAPMEVVTPCEGTGYEVGSMSIIKGARNLEAAKKFYDWALTPNAQKLAAESNDYQIPSNKSSSISEHSPKLENVKLIDYDFAKYGSSIERMRLLAKWDAEVKNLPK